MGLLPTSTRMLIGLKFSTLGAKSEVVEVLQVQSIVVKPPIRLNGTQFSDKKWQQLIKFLAKNGSAQKKSDLVAVNKLL